MSCVGLGGAWLLGRRADRPLEHGVRTVRRALELGINLIDTAECYIGGRSEEVIGAALEGWSEPVFLATKFGHRPEGFDFSRQAVVESVQESLRRLRRPAVDLIQIHTPAEPAWELLFGPGGALEGMEEVRDRGWARFFGITGRDLEFLRRCVETDRFDTLLLFWRYDLWDRSGAPLIQEAAAHRMGVLIGSPLRMGLFGSARQEMAERLSPQERQRLAELEAEYRDVPGGIKGGALRFVLSAPEVTAALSGASSPEEIEEVAALVSLLIEF